MAFDRLNCFVPYENAAASHENQLTRALLVVLRYSPMAHQAWLGMVDRGLRLHNLSKAEFATQRQHVLGTDSEVLSRLMERELVSGAERLLISDFIDLVEKHFPLIGPYSTLARCGPAASR